MNTEMPPFDNRHVRRAVSYAIDREQVASVGQGTCAPTARWSRTCSSRRRRAGRATTTTSPRRAWRATRHDRGPASATARILHSRSWTRTRRTPRDHQQQLAKIGIRIKLQVVGWPTFQPRRRRKTAHGLLRWHADFPDASTFFEPISPRASRTRRARTPPSSPTRLDGVLDRARRSTNADERGELQEGQRSWPGGAWATTYATTSSCGSPTCAATGPPGARPASATLGSTRCQAGLPAGCSRPAGAGPPHLPRAARASVHQPLARGNADARVLGRRLLWSLFTVWAVDCYVHLQRAARGPRAGHRWPSGQAATCPHSRSSNRPARPSATRAT
jgi:hypothetical protein